MFVPVIEKDTPLTKKLPSKNHLSLKPSQYKEEILMLIINPKFKNQFHKPKV